MGNAQDSQQAFAERRYWSGRRGGTRTLNQSAIIRDVLKAAEAGEICKLRRFNFSIRGGVAKVCCEKTHSTPLHIAAGNAQTECVKFLLHKGANPNSQDTSSETALHAAAKAGAAECIDILLKGKAYLEMVDAWGRTPLLKAVVYNRGRCTSRLLGAGANPNIKDADGLTPVHVAASYGQVLLLRKLVASGANLNLVNKKGKLPISKAINTGQSKMVLELLKHGARTYAEDQCVVKDTIAKLAQTHPAARENERDNYQMVDAVMCAHGYTLDDEVLDLFITIFRSLDSRLFLPILMKLMLISSRTKFGLSQHAMPHHVEQIFSFLPPDFKVFSLQNLAQRSVREALMRSGKNVLWACERLDIAPVLKEMILLKNV